MTQANVAMRLSPQRSIGIAAALLGGLLLLSAACDDGSGPSTASAPQADTAANGQPEVQAITKPTPEATAIPLDRYRYRATLVLAEQRGDRDVVSISTNGRYVSPDRHSLTYTIKLADGTELERRLVTVGERAWFQANDSGWREIARQDKRVLELLNTSFSPMRSEFLGGAGWTRVQESVEDLYGAPGSVDGVPTRHYRVGTAGKALLDTFLPPETATDTRNVTWDMWLAEEGGWPVQIQAMFTIRGKSNLLSGLELQAPATWKLLIEVTSPNDPKLMIYPPRLRDDQTPQP